MILQHYTNRALKEFNLNAYETRLWTALLLKGVASASDLSDISNVPRSRTYDVLENLEKKGFIIRKVGKPIKYIAVEPGHTIDNLKKKIIEDAESQKRKVKEIEKSEILLELQTLYQKGIKKTDPSCFSGLLNGRKKIYSHIERRIKTAKKKIHIQTTEQGVVDDKTFLFNALKKAYKNNVPVSVSAPITYKNREVAEELSKYVNVKRSFESGRFYIFDENEMIFLVMNDENAYESAVWVKSPFFTSAISNLSSKNTTP